MPVLYVTSDQPGAGKTAFCTTIASLITQYGRKAWVLKPLSKNPESDTDPAIYSKLLGQSNNGWSQTDSGNVVTEQIISKIQTTLTNMGGDHNILLVELPACLSLKEFELLNQLDNSSVIVLNKYSRNADISQFAEWQSVLGTRLLGFITNHLTRYKKSDALTNLLPAMKSNGLKSLGMIPEDRRLLGITVKTLALSLGGRFVTCEDKNDELVEHFLVGGLGMDNGTEYFGIRNNKAVIIRGDRPDIQMAALRTPTKCMLITNGIEVIEYVKYESDLNQVPVIVVDTDTLTTMESLDSLLPDVKFDHPEKLDRFKELLNTNVDMPSIYAALGMETTHS